MYRVINVNSREVLSLDPISTIEQARLVAGEIESHDSQPEVEIQGNIDGNWIKTA